MRWIASNAILAIEAVIGLTIVGWWFPFLMLLVFLLTLTLSCSRCPWLKDRKPCPYGWNKIAPELRGKRVKVGWLWVIVFAIPIFFAWPNLYFVLATVFMLIASMLNQFGLCKTCKYSKIC